MQTVHNGFHDTQPESRTAIRTGMRLIHFIEFFKHMGQVFFGNRLPGIPYMNFNLIFSPIFRIDINLLRLLHMMNGILQIVHQHFFHLEFISPKIEILGYIHLQLNAFLLEKNIHIAEYTPKELTKIQNRKIRKILPLFNGGKIHQILDHVIHPLRLIQDDVTVIGTALFLFTKTFGKPLRISHNQSNRRFQLMRHISHKFLPSLVNLVFILNIAQEFIVRIFQITYRLFQPFRKGVHRISERPDFISGIPLKAGGKIQLAHFQRQIRKFLNRFSDFIAGNIDNDDPDSKGNQAKEKQKTVKNGNGFTEAGKRHRHDERGTVVGEVAPGFHISSVISLVFRLNDGIVIAPKKDFSLLPVFPEDIRGKPFQKRIGICRGRIGKRAVVVHQNDGDIFHFRETGNVAHRRRGITVIRPFLAGEGIRETLSALQIPVHLYIGSSKYRFLPLFIEAFQEKAVSNPHQNQETEKNTGKE